MSDPQISLNGWQAAVIITPSVLGFLAAALASILGFMARRETQQVKEDLSTQAAKVKNELLIVTQKAAGAAIEAVRQNKEITAKQDELHETVNGGLAAAKAEIVSLKAQLAVERGAGNK